MSRFLGLVFLVSLVCACAPAASTYVVEEPIEKGKDPACVKKCAGKEKECISGARNSSSNRVHELCYEGYEICVKACRPKK